MLNTVTSCTLHTLAKGPIIPVLRIRTLRIGEAESHSLTLAKEQALDPGFAHSLCTQGHVQPSCADQSRGPVIPATARPLLINPRLTYNFLATQRAVFVVFYA